MRFRDINMGLIGRKVKLVSLKNSKLTESEIIKKGKTYKIFDIEKDYNKHNRLCIQLYDPQTHYVFWVNSYDIELVD